uniref:Uncharacterized protein n=1 Tax=Melanopsichium pennsylvanicum 4 TaxID=1398559 RepID=A0A077QX94_9BASI|nr:conserved hypothetical protein [Melanopsichium pennsylvanicum 4]
MTSRRSTRAKRPSYRELSDDQDHIAADDLSQDEYRHSDRDSNSADEDAHLISSQHSSEHDEQELKSSSPPGGSKKRRISSTLKPNTPSSKKRTVTPTESRTNDDGGGDWEPGVTRVIMKLVGPPQSGHVSKGQISPNVFQFLSDLEANNEREWFAQHDAVYRYCWKNFTQFIDAVLNDIMEQVDDTIPWLPTKDLVYRIYRDVRFSNDKTPYKTNLMASFSRGGRKGPFAGYHVLIKPNEASSPQDVGNLKETISP